MKLILAALWKAIGKYVISSAFFVLFSSLIVYGFSGTGKDYIQKIMNDLLKQYQVEYQQKIDEKNKLIASKDKKIIELTDQLRRSQIEYMRYYNEVVRIKKEVAAINEPKDVKEAKERLNALGLKVR